MMSGLSGSIRFISFSAFRAGSLSSLHLRASQHARSGVVLVAVFASAASASAFASRWAARLGLAVCVRRHPAGWAVSVPVVLPSSRRPAAFGMLLPVRGLRSQVQVLGWSGLGVV